MIPERSKIKHNKCVSSRMDARTIVVKGNRGGVTSVEKVIMTLICLPSVNLQVLKIPTTLSDKF